MEKDQLRRVRRSRTAQLLPLRLCSSPRQEVLQIPHANPPGFDIRHSFVDCLFKRPEFFGLRQQIVRRRNPHVFGKQSYRFNNFFGS